MNAVVAKLDWKTRFRIAVLVAVYEMYEDRDDNVLDNIRNEIWCLRHGFDPASVPDSTLSVITTRSLVEFLMLDEEQRDRRAALVLCTLKHIR